MSNKTHTETQIKKFKLLITIASIAIPLVVALLIVVKIDGYDFTFLPPIYATINGITAFFLILALIAIKRKNRLMHENLVKIAIALSILFLAMYVVYHMTTKSTPYGGEGALKMIYFFILISHILLSIAVIPMVLLSYLYAWEGKFEKHKKLTRFTWPIWFYVATTGVIVYLMISPYYN
jgi:putative membrane protein